MRTFSLNQRVRVVNSTCKELNGRWGTVVFIRTTNDSALVDMDDEPPESVRIFYPGHPRENRIELWPEECEDLEEKTNGC